MSGEKEFREYRHIKFQIDSFGFRNDKILEQSNFDILVLGDSFLVGNGVNQEKILTSLLTNHYGFKSYNLSTPGASPWDEFINLAAEFKRLRTHEGTVVLWGIFTGNDLDEYYGPTLKITQLPWNNWLGRLRSSISNFRSRSPVRSLFFRASLSLNRPSKDSDSPVIVEDFLGGRKILFYKSYYERSKRSYDDILAHPNYKKFEATVAAMKEFADKNKLTVKIVLIPTKEEVYSWVLKKSHPWTSSVRPSGFCLALQELSQKYGLEILDLKPFLIQESKSLFEKSGNLFWWYDDTHWNDKGHTLAASIIYNEILSSKR